jgi:hypothetical protein
MACPFFVRQPILTAAGFEPAVICPYEFTFPRDENRRALRGLRAFPRFLDAHSGLQRDRGMERAAGPRLHPFALQRRPTRHRNPPDDGAQSTVRRELHASTEFRQDRPAVANRFRGALDGKIARCLGIHGSRRSAMGTAMDRATRSGCLVDCHLPGKIRLAGEYRQIIIRLSSPTPPTATVRRGVIGDQRDQCDKKCYDEVLHVAVVKQLHFKPELLRFR